MLDREVIRGLLESGDPHFLQAKSFLESEGFDLLGGDDRALDWCIAKADSGDLQAEYIGAVLLAFGLCGLADKVQALNLCRRAAARAYPPAVLLLASFHEEGWGGAQIDTKRALELMLEAANTGNVAAMHAAALFYQAHDELPEAPAKARELLRQASELDYPQSQAALATLLLQSEDPSSTREAISLMQRAAEQDFAHAHRMLGYYYKGGQYGLPKDSSKATAHFKRAEDLESGNW
jgi:uncharacterized protein